MKHYIAFITMDEPTFNVVFPDFPGCISAGKDFEDAVRMAHEALAGHVECMKDAQLTIPDPGNLEQIKQNWPDWKDWKDWKGSEYTTALIALVPCHETRKYTISMDSSLMARIDAVTKNRSAFLAKAAEDFLGSHAGATS
jgi:predicted RNase H-like HicB family nuclease